MFSLSGEELNSIWGRIIKLTKNWSTSLTLRKTSKKFSSVLLTGFLSLSGIHLNSPKIQNTIFHYFNFTIRDRFKLMIGGSAYSPHIRNSL